MLNITYAGCHGLYSAISKQFTLKICVATRSHEKFTKTPYFEGSRSFKVIDVNTPKSSSPVLNVMIKCMSVPIYLQPFSR